MLGSTGPTRFAELFLERASHSYHISDHRCGINDLRLAKTNGSAFSGFIRDEYTALQDSEDRPLCIALSTYWKYIDWMRAIERQNEEHVGTGEVESVIIKVFDEVKSLSIQHLLYGLGLQILEAFPSMEVIHLEAENRSWRAVEGRHGAARVNVYTDGDPSYGLIKLTLTR